jgi:hypothetical protein
MVSSGDKTPMDEKTKATFIELDRYLRKASVARIGGFRPPDDPSTSWFGGRGVGLPGEQLPRYKGREMFPLLQVNVDELPHVPDALKGVKLFIVFQNREEIPFNKSHGDGWLIREYASLEGLVLLPRPAREMPVRPFPIRWELVEDEAPGWEDAWELVDLTLVNESEAASDFFFEKYQNYPGTKIGGYPTEVQHGVGIEGFVFQIGSEEKPHWMWADNGIAYYSKAPGGEWRFSCQFL